MKAETYSTKELHRRTISVNIIEKDNRSSNDDSNQIGPRKSGHEHIKYGPIQLLFHPTDHSNGDGVT